MVDKNYESLLKEMFPGRDVTVTGPRRFWLDIPSEELVSSVQAVREKLGLNHLATIVAEDLRDSFLVNYFLAGEVIVTLRVRIADRENPKIPSLANLVPGAIVYERENYDMYGIVPEGHPDLRRQALPDDWPEGVFPLRKDVVLPRPSLANKPQESK